MRTEDSVFVCRAFADSTSAWAMTPCISAHLSRHRSRHFIRHRDQCGMNQYADIEVRTCPAVAVLIDPVCRTFVNVPRAGMQAMTRDPDASFDSSAVGSNHTSGFRAVSSLSSSKSIAIGLTEGGREQAEHAATRPSISNPASARAALAAIDADATHAASPSTSSTVTNTSIVDFGKSSRRKEGWMDCWTCTEAGRSSTS